MYETPIPVEPQYVEEKPDDAIEPAPARELMITGLEFRCLRLSLGLSVPEFSDYVGYTPKAIYWIESHPSKIVAPTPARYMSYLLEESEYWRGRMPARSEVRKSGYRLLSNGLPVPESWWAALVGSSPLSTPVYPRA